MDEPAHPAIPWPGFSPERAFVLPLRADRMDSSFGDACEIAGVRLQRKTEFHATVLDREMARIAGAAWSESRLRALYESLAWVPYRTGRYALLRESKGGDTGARTCWSLIEHLQLTAMCAFRAELARHLGSAFADPVPHVTHYVCGDPNGIGVPNGRALEARLVQNLGPGHHPFRTDGRPH